MIYRNFRNSDILVFYSFNGDMKREEIIKQINELASQGVTGFFVHARAGLEIDYMQEEWFDRFQLCIDLASKLNMSVYIYDENGWPSGTCGGLIPAMGDIYRYKYLKFSYGKPSGIKNEYILATYTPDLNGYRRTFTDDIKNTDLVAYYNLDNNYVDLLSHDTVKEFILHTHEVYKKHFGQYFGNIIKGIFTDEPLMKNNCITWSLGIPDIYKKKYGGNILDELWKLNTDNFDSSFCDIYMRLLSELFQENFSKQIGDWCKENKLFFTGHYSSEDGLKSQILSNGGVMPHYLYQQIPGIDHLGCRLASPVLMKQISSAAEMQEKPLKLSEVFGCAGWNVSFNNLAWIWGWHAAFGINLPCLHLSAYTIKGRRKRDYPAFFSYQEPWWNDFHYFANWMKNVNTFINKGYRRPQVLVISDVDGTRGYSLPAEDEGMKINSVSNQFRYLLKNLLDNQIDFDIGDSTILSNIGARVENGCLIAGPFRYSYIIVPEMPSISSYMYRLLKEFISHGGNVIFVNSRPKKIDFKNSIEISNNRLGVLVRNRCDLWTKTFKTLKYCRTAQFEDNDTHIFPENVTMRCVFDGDNQNVLLFNSGTIGDYSNMKFSVLAVVLVFAIPTGASANEGNNYIDNSSLLPKYVSDDKVQILGDGTLDYEKHLIMAELRIETATKEGTFQSATKVLDHYAEMGVNCLWIDPIYNPFGYCNNGPDTIDPRLTGTDDIEESYKVINNFMNEAHKRNIRIIFDIIVWGTAKDSPLVTEHPEFYVSPKQEAYSGWVWDWNSKELQNYFNNAAVNFIMKTGADGFRVDLAPDTSGYYFKNVKKACLEKGRKILVMSEMASNRKGAFDLDQGSVGWGPEDHPWDNPSELAKLKKKYGNHGTAFIKFNLVECVKTGYLIGSSNMQANKLGGTLRYYTFNLCNHDDQTTVAKGSRVKFGYQAVFSPFLPIWWIGEEWNNPLNKSSSGVMYYNSIDWDKINDPDNRAFYEDIKKYIRIRRENADVFEIFPSSTRDSNIAKVDTYIGEDENSLQAYARYIRSKAILIVPNNEEEKLTFTIQPNYDKIGLKDAVAFKITDLYTGKTIFADTAKNLESFDVTIDSDNIGIYKITPILAPEKKTNSTNSLVTVVDNDDEGDDVDNSDDDVISDNITNNSNTSSQNSTDSIDSNDSSSKSDKTSSSKNKNSKPKKSDLPESDVDGTETRNNTAIVVLITVAGALLAGMVSFIVVYQVKNRKGSNAPRRK